MSTFQAKFRLSTVEDARYAPEGAVTVQFQGVQGEPFGSSTPFAHATMSIHNPAVAAILKERYRRYLDAIQARLAAIEAGTADKTAAYPTQPEFLVTFAPDDES